MKTIGSIDEWGDNPVRTPAGEAVQLTEGRDHADEEYLRAERFKAEADRLRGQLAEARQEAREDYARAEQAEAALVVAKAEIARLKAGDTA